MRNYLLYLIVAASLAITSCDRDKETETDVEDEVGTVIEDSPDMPVADESGDEIWTDDAAPAETHAEPAAVSYGPNDVVMAITDLDGAVRLVLTPSSLSMRLSDAAVDRVRMRVNERGLGDDLKKAMLESLEQVVRDEIESAVGQGMKRMNRKGIRYDLREIESIHYQEGRLWIGISREKPLSFDDIRTADGRPVLANFDENDALALVEAYDSL